MRKLGIYFVIFTLVVSLCPIHPITTYAEDTESKENEELLSDEVNVLSDSDSTEDEVEYKEEEIVLFSEKSEEEIEFFEDIPKQDEEATLTIPDDTEAILLISEEEDNIDSEEEDFAFIQYTYIDENTDNKEEITVEGYVHIDHIVPVDEASAFKKEREEQELIEEEKNEEAEDEEAGIEDEIDVDNKDGNNDDQDSNEDTDEADSVVEENELNSDEKNEQSEVKKEDESIVSKQQTSAQPFATSVLKKGDRAPEVIQLKKDLARLGFTVPGTGTNLYGTQTEKKVKEFQKYYGLSQTGTVNNATNNKIKEILASPLRKGERHNDTLQLKKDLAFINMPVPGKGTALYGTVTENAVKDFQKRYNLAVNGIADEVTLAKIKELKEAPLENGTRREDVKTLKQDLAKLGFTVPGTRTNLYGTQTEKKVIEFQKYYGLSQTGTVNNATNNKIKEILSSPLRKGESHNDTLQLKKDLAFINMPVPGKGTTLYGTVTENAVKDFQKKYNLVVNGIADEITLAKIKELKEAPLENGTRREDVKTLKQDLAKLGFTVPGTGTNLYGTQTEKKVKEFQKYYGLSQTGTVNNATKSKIKEIIESPLQKGKRHKDTVQMKKDLAKVGFTVPGTGTDLYGTQTEKVVKEFQKYYKLTVNGIADGPTLKKIEQINNSPLQKGKKHKDTIQLKKDLAKIGYPVPGNGTNLFGTVTENVVKEFQKQHNLVTNGIADEITLAKIAQLVKDSETKPINITEYTDYKLTLNQAVDIQMNRPIIQTDKYRNDAAYVSANYLSIIGLSSVYGIIVIFSIDPNT